MPQHSVPWTVVVPTVQGWPGVLGTTWNSLVSATAEGGGELVVVFDGREPRSRCPGAGGVPLRIVATGGGAGYGGACNAGLGCARGRRVLFLNDDVAVPEDLLPALEAAWEGAPRVGAVVPDVWSEKLGRSESGCRLTARMGLLDAAQLPLEEVNRPDYPCGAAVAMEADLIRRLEGWETLYAPGYWEDVDLGLTLSRRGLTVIPVPAVRVRHLHGRSMDALGSTARRVLYERNRVLCSLKHLEGGLVVFAGWVVLRALAAVARDRAVAQGTLRALRLVGAALGRRRALRAGVAREAGDRQ